MPLMPEALPLASPFDPLEDAPSSIDPLGTSAHAERLAELLLPGFTARMLRARLLTFSAVATAITDRAVPLLGDREDARLEARLAFERLFVSAVVRQAQKDPENYKLARRRLPGIDLARNALAAREPLTRNNFLKGQAVNGPFGVMARLARNLELIDDEGRLGRHGLDLLLTWAEEQGLDGFLDEHRGAERPGAAWADEAARRVAKLLKERDWPGPASNLWESLAEPLRLDQSGPKEQRFLLGLLDEDARRKRVIEILRARVEVYQQVQAHRVRGEIERTVLLALREVLGGDPMDRFLRAAAFAVHVYETASLWLLQGFDSIVWGLKQLSGRAAPEKLLEDGRLRGSLGSVVIGLKAGLGPLERTMTQLSSEPELDSPALIEPLAQLRDDIIAASSPLTLLTVLMRRHERVQRDKKKGPWIDRDQQWTLLPGFGIKGEEVPNYSGFYLHSFRITNAYALLMDLGAIQLEDSDGEE